MQKNRKGFTLIELLIVVVIIGILAAIAIPKFANTKEKAYVTAMKSDLRNLMTAEEAYFSDSTKYTTAFNTTGAAGTDGINFKWSTGVNQPVITLGVGGYTAHVTHTQTTIECEIAVGLPNGINANAGDGEPVCQ
jgi:type IV pilus assembly protein PilA